MTAFLTSLVTLFLPNYYKSIAVLKVKDDDNSYSSLAGSFTQSLPGGVSSLLGGLNQGDQKRYVMDILSSKTFLKEFLSIHDFLPDIMATKRYDQKDKKIIYDEKIYDLNSKTWTRKPKGKALSKPSYIEAHKKFKEKMLSLVLNPESGFITIGIEHKSPEKAYEILNLYIKEADSFFRVKNLKEANESLNYLNKKISQISINTVKNSASELIKINLNKAMIAEVSENYLLEVLDEPFIPEKKSWPRRTDIVLTISLLSLFFTCLFILLRSTNDLE